MSRSVPHDWTSHGSSPSSSERSSNNAIDRSLHPRHVSCVRTCRAGVPPRSLLMFGGTIYEEITRPVIIPFKRYILVYIFIPLMSGYMVAQIPEYVRDPAQRYVLIVVAIVCGLFYMLVWAMKRRSVGDPRLNRYATIVLKVMFVAGFIWGLVPDSRTSPQPGDSRVGPKAAVTTERTRALVGRWQHTDGQHFVTLEYRRNGTFYGSIERDGRHYARFWGDWAMDHDDIRYSYLDSNKPGAPTGSRDTEHIIRLDDRTLVLRSIDGNERTYQLIARPSE